MKRVGIAICLVFGLYGAAWLTWAQLTEATILGWIEGAAGPEQEVRVEPFGVSGFPTRFLAEVDGFAIEDLRQNAVWRVGPFAVRQAAWDIGTLEVTGPTELTVEKSEGTGRFAAEAFSAQVALDPLADPALEAMSVTGAELVFQDVGTAQVRLSDLDGTITRYEGTDAYRGTVSLSGLDLPGALVAALSPAGGPALPARIHVLRADADVNFTGPWDNQALLDVPPQPTQVNLRDAQIGWGAMRVAVSGRFDLNERGQATGALDLRVENWPLLLDVVGETGLVPSGMLNTARTTLTFLAGLSGQPETLDATLRLDEGFVFLGPLPIGQAPPLRLY